MADRASDLQLPNLRRCTLTLYDETTPGITFDEEGVCNFARESQWRLENEVFRGDVGKARLEDWVRRIKAAGQGRDYDCIVGVSGGVDSSVVAARVVELGLRPLAIHLDNGWNTDTAVGNIERLVKALDIDLVTHVVDWEEIRDLQRAYIRASVLDLECVSDHAINAITYRTAAKHRIRFVVHGGNVATESTMPPTWGYDKRDGTNVLAIHRRYGSVPLRTYPRMRPQQFAWYLFVANVKAFGILNYLDYNKSAAIEELKSRFGWRPYPRKHGENLFTRFHQEIWLPQKFGIDKRVTHLSSLILSGEMTREAALEQLAQPLFTPEEEQREREFVAKKLGFSSSELDQMIAAPGRPHTDFPNSSRLFDHNRLSLQVARRVAKGEFRWSEMKELRARYASA